MSSTSRLLLLLSLLQTRRDWPGAVLADRLHVTDRTVRRDVDRLREMGYRIHASKGPDGGYRLEAGSALPPLLFDDEQAIALAVVLQSAVGSGADIEEAAVRALTTVRQVMPSRLRHRLDALRFTTLAAQPDSSTRADPHVLLSLSTAIRDHAILRFDYARSGSSSPRRTEPHHVVMANGLWYLVAWDLDHDDWRLFRVDRISPKVPAGPRYSPRVVPGGNVSNYVSAKFKGAANTNAWPCIGTVILDLPAGSVIPFAGDGTVEVMGPERCRLRAGSWSWTALAASMGRFDAPMEVEDPPQLADAFRLLADRFAHASAPSTHLSKH
ncbi:putative DNA-binding transcriptional regulator YafY [Okibacterium sp. HSC-33S16]|uniref:helix-turn-helix transcriptional regulator n=1 Tax=Okibacterium sp. HSC-33S16 TaxID=2910965 RepID=UPI0020A1E0D3|nr:WYL domain-containing protein [Okibacterium sp. HSC-33S16]MCP2030290.1 putative DNA-binding transcriptional regulator YafY [Okibacterium sp. HSC-33S16]